MLTRRELEEAIEECENESNHTMRTCEKLATLYTVYNHMFPQQIESRAMPNSETFVDDYGNSELFSVIRDKDAESVWMVIDELMCVLQSLMPKLYDSTIRKLDEI